MKKFAIKKLKIKLKEKLGDFRKGFRFRFKTKKGSVRFKVKRKIVTKKELERLKKEIEYFHREFRKLMTNFITGALAFVAALLWRDAIKSLLESYRESIEQAIPFKQFWITQFVVAFAVSIVSVIGIIFLTRFLKPQSE